MSKGFLYHQTSLFLVLTLSDGIIYRDFHAPRLIEVKRPFTQRGLSIEDYSKQKNTCLELRENSVKLKKSHSYFYQVQCQMGVTGVHLCEFCVCTTVDSHVELIELDELFWQTNAKKTNIFYCDIIIPELIRNCTVQILTLPWNLLVFV